MGRLLDFLGGNAMPALCLGVFLGVLLPGLSELARPLLAACVVILLVATLLRVDWTSLAQTGRRPLVLLAVLIWLLVISPVFLWALTLPAGFLPDSLIVALILMAAAPPIMGATSIAILLGLDGALILVASLLACLLAPATLPPIGLALLGLDLQISLVELTLRMAALIFLAFAIAGLLRHLLKPHWLKSHARHIDGLVVLTMLIFAVAIMDGVTAALLTRPQTVVLWIAAAFVANPLLQLLTAFAFGWLGRRQALTVGLAAGNRNMGLVMAALPPDSDFDVFLFFALAQLPMYMLPAALGPLYRRLSLDGYHQS